MKKILCITFLLFGLFFQKNTFAQELGGHPASVKWKTINSTNVRVIFPEGQSEKAFRMANIIDLMNEKHSASIGNKSKKIDLVLQTNQVLSNGYVALAPFRSEFFATPFQNNTFLGSMDWLDALSIHEYRHAQQFLNGNRGLTKLGHILQGQNGWNVAMFFSIPNWFFEGDATMTETVLTGVGRGRTPAFFQEQRALLLNGKDYAYMKARNGSFKDMLPNHYPFGYGMINYARNNFGEDIWRKVLADAGRYRTIIYPFSGALKKHTGMRPPELYKKTYEELKQNWEKELEILQIIENQKLTAKPNRTVTNYLNAQYLNDGSILVVKSSYKKTPALYQIKDGKEKKLIDIGVEPEGYLSENNNRVAWTELKLDVRRGNRNYTVIKSYDLNTKKKRTITKKSKLFSPQFSASGDRIVAVQADENLKNKIVILDAETGVVSQSIDNPNNDFISYPKWTKDDQAIVFLVKRNSRLAFFKYNFSENTNEQLSEWTAQTIGNFSIGKDKVFFNGGSSGIDNIYSIGLNGEKNMKQITSVKIGAYMPDVSEDGKKIVMSELTEMGNMLTELDLSKGLNQVISIVKPSELSRYNISLSEEEGDILNKIPNKEYEVKKYRGFLKGTKLHSWNFVGDRSEPALNLAFANILNDFTANVLVGYNTNEEVMKYGGTISYGKLFPIITLGTQVGNRNFDYLTSVDTIGEASFGERIISGGVSIPLSWQNGNYSTKLNLSVVYSHRTLDKSAEFPNQDLDFGVLQTGLSFSNVRRRALQNVLPRFGQTLSVNYFKGVENGDVEKVNASAVLYLPGLLANHGIKIEGAYQKELLTNSYQFSDDFFSARGYDYIANDEISRLSFNYQLPLFYPDWGFAGITYFQRLRANLFYDVAQSKLNYNNTSTTQRSYGFEIIFDNTALNLFPISIGLRNAWRLDAAEGEGTFNFGIFTTVNF